MAAAASSSDVSMKSSNETGRLPMEGQKSNSTNSGAKRGIIPVAFSAFFFSISVSNFRWSGSLIFSGFITVVDPEMALYTELWHACAGPLVTVPREGERVYYFPQGHIEQVLYIFWLNNFKIYFHFICFFLIFFSIFLISEKISFLKLIN